MIDPQTGREIEGPGEGFLCFKRPHPSMMRTLAGDHERFEATYFSQCKVNARNAIFALIAASSCPGAT